MGIKKNDTISENVQEVNLLDYIYVVMQWRRLILAIVGGIFIITLSLMYLVLPRWYKSTSVILPPKQKNQFSTTSLIRGMVPLGGLGLGRASDELYNYMAILKSRSCRAEIIQQFDLIKRYNADNIESALKELDDNTTIETTRDDVALEISVFDTDSTIAAQITNFYVLVLNNINLKLATQEAKSNREFLEKRYNKNISDLKTFEDNLKVFQQKYGVYSLPEQLKAAIQAAAEIKSQITIKEIEVNIFEKSLGSDDPRILRSKIELSELNKKLKQMKYGSNDSKNEFEILPSFDHAPELGMQYIRLFRDVEIQQHLLEILMPLFEQAKIEEHRDTPTMLILDEGVPAVEPSKPRRLITTLIVTFISFIISIFVVFILDFFRRTHNELEKSEDVKLQFIRSQLHWKILFSWKSTPNMKDK